MGRSGSAFRLYAEREAFLDGHWFASEHLSPAVFRAIRQIWVDRYKQDLTGIVEDLRAVLDPRSELDRSAFIADTFDLEEPSDEWVFDFISGAHSFIDAFERFTARTAPVTPERDG